MLCIVIITAEKLLSSQRLICVTPTTFEVPQPFSYSDIEQFYLENYVFMTDDDLSSNDSI